MIVQKMEENNEADFRAWEEDVQFLTDTLSELFESSHSRYYVDDVHNSLYIELEGLAEYDDDEIAELAGPVLSELDLDFENVILLPYRD